MDWGWVNCLSDIFRLSDHRAEWIKQPGFGVKSVDKILDSIQAARNTTLDKFISSLGIPFIGQTISKDLVKLIPTYEEFKDKAQSKFDFSEYPGFAGSKTLAIWNYDFTEADRIYPYLIFETQEKVKETTNNLEGITVCVTGKLNLYKNRAALQSDIEAAGGKVTSSVSKNTNYLINNDKASTSSKNLTAQKLGIPIITEQEFVDQFLTK
jgi:DNA ligase (NAD+)